MFAQVSTDQVVEGFGLPAAIVIIALVGALIFTVRLLIKSYDNTNGIQERRIADAKETRDKLIEPLQQQATLSKQIYDIVLNNSQGK